MKASTPAALKQARSLVARDTEGNVPNEGIGRHAYEFRGDLVARMTIED